MISKIAFLLGLFAVINAQKVRINMNCVMRVSIKIHRSMKKQEFGDPSNVKCCGEARQRSRLLLR